MQIACYLPWTPLELIDALVGCVQNVDRLHHKAGSSNILELHGTTHRYFLLANPIPAALPKSWLRSGQILVAAMLWRLAVLHPF